MRLLPSAGLALSCFVTALTALAAVGCASPSNDAPIIDYVDSPLVVTAEHGSYTIPVSLGFHDNDSEVVTRVHYRLPPSIDEIIEIKTPIPTSQSADVVIVIPAPMPGSSDVHQLEITIFDGRGAESLPLPREVTLH
jgi:hypothetical protein